LLAKTLKIFRTYPRENAASVHAVDELTRVFCEHLLKHQSLELFVERSELQWQGVPVYSEPDPRKSVALKLDRNGVRRIEFHDGITRAEMVSLLEALTTEVDEESLEDDIVTLLWEKQLSHVKVYVLDEMSTGQEAFDDNMVSADEPQGAPREGSSEGSTSKSTSGASWDGSPSTGVILPTLCAATKAKLHPLTEEQTATLHGMTSKEASHDVSEDLTDILFDVLRGEAQKEVTGNALKVLIDLVMMCVKDGLFGRSADVLGRLRALAAGEDVDKDVRGRITQQLLSMADPSSTKTILDTLRDRGDINQVDLGRFLTMLPTAAAGALCEMIRVEPYGDIVLSAVKYLVKDDPKVLTSKLASSDVAMAKGVLAILEQVAGPELTQAIFDPLMAAEIPVKLASVNLLLKLKGKAAQDLLLNYVASADAVLRKAALKAVAGLGEPQGPVAVLREQLTDKNLSSRTLDEKKSLLVTLAKIESHHAIALLQGILAGRRWFEKSGHAETRACAALALGEIDDDRAREILERYSSDKAEAVRTATRLVLSRGAKTAATVGN
jgi:HEAT repeat protein